MKLENIITDTYCENKQVTEIYVNIWKNATKNVTVIQIRKIGDKKL